MKIFIYAGYPKTGNSFRLREILLKNENINVISIYKSKELRKAIFSIINNSDIEFKKKYKIYKKILIQSLDNKKVNILFEESIVLNSIKFKKNNHTMLVFKRFFKLLNNKNNQIKAILYIRNHVDMLHSLVNQFENRWKKSYNFNVKKILDNINNKKYSKIFDNLHYISNYKEIIRLNKKKNTRLVLYEDFKKNNLKHIKDEYKFLGLNVKMNNNFFKTKFNNDILINSTKDLEKKRSLRNKLKFKNLFNILKITRYFEYFFYIKDHFDKKKYFEKKYFEKNSKTIKEKYRKDLLSIKNKKIIKKFKDYNYL